VEDPEGQLQELLIHKGTHAFCQRFQKAYDIVLRFDKGALQALAEEAAAKKVPVEDLCHQKFNDYGHGLNLLGEPEFQITEAAVRQPKEHLDKLVKAFYKKK